MDDLISRQAAIEALAVAVIKEIIRPEEDGRHETD